MFFQEPLLIWMLFSTLLSYAFSTSPRTVDRNCYLTFSFCCFRDIISSCCFFLFKIWSLPASSISCFSVFYFLLACYSCGFTSKAKEWGFDGSNLLICIALFLVPDWSPFLVSLSISLDWCPPEALPLFCAFELVKKTSLAGTIWDKIFKAWLLSFSRFRLCFQWMVPVASPSSSRES